MIAALDPNELKRAAAARALEYVESGMKLGLGTGSTAEIFLELLAEGMRGGLKIVGTAPSARTAVKAPALEIPLQELNGLKPTDLRVVGAADGDRHLDLLTR